ncbi:GYD domain-containing protein [Streptomyces sp. Caat 7-52]|uniref:GYD domain-containing protein n=1 Tax=Streptomyces sp. Caat 7-52 TaxID=2949637 RepID=UPI0020363D3F|nr:GYD domain-containing protein [Streptomyces sp. Caat 7-52]
MPKFLIQAAYTPEGTKGLLEEGASGRRAAVDQVVTGLGGTVEAMYYAFGEDDLVCIVDFPDPVRWRRQPPRQGQRRHSPHPGHSPAHPRRDRRGRPPEGLLPPTRNMNPEHEPGRRPGGCISAALGLFPGRRRRSTRPRTSPSRRPV